MKTTVSKLRTAAIVIGNLPELPGYNGSVLTIDDEEAARISADIYEAVTEIEKLRELVRLIFESTMPYRENGECVFIDKVTDMWIELCPVEEVQQPKESSDD